MAANRVIPGLSHPSASNRSSTSLITPKVTALSDPPSHTVDQQLVQYLTNEVIRLIIDSEAVARARQAEYDRLVQQQVAQSSKASGAPLGAASSASAKQVTQTESDEAVRTRLDTIGYKVGWAISERLGRDILRFPTTPASTASSTPAASSALAPVPDPLETVKFVCKDLWIALYDKQIDNLRTNHRGVYVLHDNTFRPLIRISARLGEEKELDRRIKFFLSFPCGIIRGALANVGVSCVVTAESAAPPQSTFQIKLVKSGGV